MKKIYYGWCNVGIGLLSMSFAPAVMAFFTLGVYMPVLAQEFDWTRTQISAASTIGTLSSAAFSPFIGRAVDAIGVRTILLSAIGLFVCVFSSLYFLSFSLVHFYGAYFLIGMIAPITTLSYTRTIVAWFDRNRGIALGLTMAGTGIGAGLLPPLAQFLIDLHGWRVSYVGLGALAGIVSLPLVALFLREHPPRDEADAAAAGRPREIAIAAGTDYGMLKTEAVKTVNFWTLIAIFLIIAIALHGLTVHFVPILIGMDLSALKAAGFMSVFGIAVIFGRLACGFIVDRVFAPYVASGVFALSALGIMLLLFEPGMLGIAASAFLFGLSVGAETDLLGYLVARYFGLLRFGELYGYVFSAFMVGTSIGPIVLGIVFDTTGSYHIGLLTVVSLLLLSAALCLRLGAFPDWDRPPADRPRS